MIFIVLLYTYVDGGSLRWINLRSELRQLRWSNHGSVSVRA